MYEAKIIADSISPDGKRLTTMEVTYPRYIHAEMMTHRVFSRNSASSRAIPVHKMIERVRSNPVIPIEWGSNKAGMQAGEPLDEVTAAHCKYGWVEAAKSAADEATRLNELGLHKQVVNRLLEPFLWHTVIISATDWRQFFHQRCDPHAQPEMQKIAWLMREARDSSTPKLLGAGDWHLPYITKGLELLLSKEEQKKVSVARCARVSYENQGGRSAIGKDMDLFDKLKAGNHWSPFEHVATPVISTFHRYVIDASSQGFIRLEINGQRAPIEWLDNLTYHPSNFWGWNQFRKFQTDENRETLLLR